MALTRAQLLAGNQSQGVVLPGQVQAVSQGLGVFIDTDGTISVDASTAEGLVRLNNNGAYNGYIWPNTIGQPDQFLQLVDASGTLRWADAGGFAVVTVSPTQPTPPDEGELWYNCNTGSLLVYQNCVAPGGWTNVAQPGLEVTPGNTSAVPPFTNQGTPNAGTLANPYDCTVTTVVPGTSVFIVNRVTVVGLAPYQFVPIVDMNAVVNGGRFHFSNNYANAAGVLEFETIFIDLPPSTSGTNYTAAIRVGYASVYIEAIVNVVAPLTLTWPGSLSGSPATGSTLTYTRGSAAGGIGTINYTWQWKNDLGTVLASGSGTGPQTYFIPVSQVGRTISVTLTATDSAIPANSVSGSTPPTAIVVATPITNAQFPTTIPGTASFTWNDGNGATLTASDCIEFDVNGSGSFVTSATVNNSDTIRTQWKITPACGGAAQNTTINGTLTSGGLISNGSITINRLPTSVTLNPTTRATNVNVLITPVNFSTTGANTEPLIWGILSAGTTPEYSIDGGTAWIPLPNSPTAANTIPLGVTALVRYTTGSAGTETLELRAGYSDTAGEYQSAVLTTTVTMAPFPAGVWNPTPSGGLNTIPGGISGPYTGAGPITTTGCIEASVNGGPYSTGTQPITSGQTLAVRWSSSALCGGAATGTNLTGTVSDGTFENSYAVTVNRKPNPALANISDTNVALATTKTKSLAAPVAGLTAPAYITLGTGSTGTGIQVATDGATFVTVPAAPSTLIPVTNGQTITIRQTVGSAISTGYTAIINVGDSTGGGGAATTYQTVTYTATTVNSAVFPNSVFTPANAPNASPATVSQPAPFMPTAINGTASTTWADGSVTLTGSNMQLAVGAGAFANSQVVANSNTVKVAWLPSYINGLADGAGASGSFTDGIHTNSYTFTVDKQPSFTLPALTTGAALSTQQTTNVFTPNNFNCPITISFTNPTTGGSVAMGSVLVSINNGPTTAITLGTTTVTLNPGDTIQIFGNTGGANSTKYGLTVTMGAAAAQEWLVETGAGATPSIGTPSITSPANGATNLKPQDNSPAGLTLSSDGYSPSGGAGSQTGSTWEVYSGSAGGTPIAGSPFTVSASPFNTLFIPQSSLAVSTTYYARVKYSTTTPSPISSSFSGYVNFTTASSFLPSPGTAYGGGYFAGQINDSGTIYNLVVAPFPSGVYGGVTPASITYKTTATADFPTATYENTVYGKPANDAGNDASHPAFQWARSLSIGGFTDWYIPALYELNVCYYFLKPSNAQNSAGGLLDGKNPYAVSPQPVNTSFDNNVFPPTNPPKTSATNFQSGVGAQAFDSTQNYWTSTQSSAPAIGGSAPNAAVMSFQSGFISSGVKDQLVGWARAIRRVSA